MFKLFLHFQKALLNSRKFNIYYTNIVRIDDTMNKDDRQLVKVATMYYKEGMTQAEIAKKLGVSRSLISKMLINAKNEGIVEVFIQSKSALSVKLERGIEKKFHIKEAVVIETYSLSDEEIYKVAAQEAALYLEKISKDAKSIGISWGKSLRGLVNAYPYTNQENITVIPLIGGMSANYFDIHSNQLTYDLASRMNGKAKYLYAPNFINSDKLREKLINNRAVTTVLEAGKEVDIALVGIANSYKNSTMFEIGYIDKSLLEDFEKYDVVGDINSRFFNEKGVEVDAYFNEFSIGLKLEDLKKIPIVMTVALENYKEKAIRIALDNRLVNVIVMTDEMAKKLLDA